MLAFTACHDQPQWNDDPYGNFDALWTILDEHYPFFEYKDVDWEQVRVAYRAKISPKMTTTELFDLCGAMLKELRDGHVNLIASHDVSRYTHITTHSLVIGVGAELFTRRLSSSSSPACVSPLYHSDL